MAEKENRSLSELFIEKANLTCEKEFGHLLEQDSAARYGDAYAKYIDYALVRLEGMVSYAENLQEGHAAAMTVVHIFSGWRNRLHAVRDCKENMRVFSRSEREIVNLFREFCRGCVDMVTRLSGEDGASRETVAEYARNRKGAVLSILGELFPMPEIYEISDLYPIPSGKVDTEGKAAIMGEKPGKMVRITVELSEKEALAFETIMIAEKKIRAALEEAGCQEFPE
ncbi:MAG: hypothetical protein H6Q57_113 [Geobacteraceae bacterium]|nr:hypothetical protein [Geobacteraceae bacterium]